MKRTLMALLAAAVLALLAHGLALGQEQTYTLEGYMPQTTGSKWVLRTTGRQGETTITYEVGEPKEFAGQQAMPILQKDAQGNLQRGSYEAVTEEGYTLFGSVMMPRGPEAGAAPLEMTYEPAAAFPGTMKVGDRSEATVTVTRPNGTSEITLSLELAAVETVTVPKGTFEGCLKLVYATTFGERTMARTAWYAEGVGLVKTESGGVGPNRAPRVAELTDYQLAE